MKHLRLFKTENEYKSATLELPNVSYVEEIKGVSYEPKKPKKAFVLRAKYNATPDNLVAFNDANNVASLKVNGTSVKIEPIKNENTTFDVLGENISVDVEAGMVTSLPESYLIKSPVSSWSFKAKDPNYVINENTYICMLGIMDGATLAQPMPIMDVIGNTFITNDGVTLELIDTFLAEMNMQIQSGLQIGFTLMDVDTNNENLKFIDTEHQTNVTTGGLPTYSFDSEGLYDVEIELSDPVIKMKFTETPLISIEIGNGITTIGEYTFEGCGGLTSVVIPDSVTSIGNYAFNSCSGLTGELVIPNGITSIGEWTFQACSSLTSVHIGSGVTTINDFAFYGCSGLTSIDIPDSVTEIGESAFGKCSGLTNVTIGSGVTSIGDNTFANCSSLNEIICKGNIAPHIQNMTFGSKIAPIKKFGVLKVPGNADYSSWMNTNEYYLGYYNWTIQYI